MNALFMIQEIEDMQRKSIFFPRMARMATLAAALMLLVPATNLLACGWGSQGGADYVPQRRGGDQQQKVAQQQPLSAEEAQQIVRKYVTPINPNLIVGKPNDAGPYFEVDLQSKDGETVQVIGVDKYSGRMQPLS
jgi:hypothetical protein